MEELGTILKQAREKQNLSVELVCEKTKIRPHIIIELESGEFKQLTPVYAKSFIKTYAEFLKIPKEQINQYLEDFSKKHRIIQSNIYTNVTKNENSSKSKYKLEALRKKSQLTWATYLIYSALILAVLSMIYFTIFSDSDTPSIDPDEITGSGPDTAVIGSEEKGLLSFFEKPDSLILEAKASDSAWISIDIDGKFNERLLLYPGSDRRWGAKEYFMLTVGNVGAVRFYRNGQLLEPFGNKGSVIRNIKVTKDKVENSSAPWSGTNVKKKVETPEKKILIEESNLNREKPNLRKEHENPRKKLNGNQ